MTDITERLRKHELGPDEWLSDLLKEGATEITRLRAELAARDWKPINFPPTTPCMVRFYCAKLMLHESDGTCVSPLIEPYRDEANALGYFDGREFYYLGTGHEIFEFEYQIENDDSPTHYQILSPPPRLEIAE